MRLLAPILLPALAISLLAQPAAADDLAATSEIEAVTVFSSGALVTRKLTREIPVGNHTLIINDLPAGAVHSSIRVEGNADGDLQIGAVDIKRVSVTSDEAAARDAERKRLEDELEKLTDAMDTLRADIEVKETQKTLITNLAGLPQQPPAPAGASGQAQDWSKLLDLIGSGMTDLQSAILKARIAMRELGREIEDTKKKLAELAPKQESRTELRIALQAGADLNADLKLRYQVARASWAPLYEARLTAGTDTNEPQLALTRRASITQHTGESWKAVALTLSTSRPSTNTSAPNVWPLTVDFYSPPKIAPMSGQLSMRSAGGRAKALAEAAPAKERDARQDRARYAAAPRAVANAQATLQRTAFEASFTVPGRVDVENTGEAKRVELSKETIKPKLEVRTVPRQASIAYLYANLTLPKAAPYLAGQIALFRDNTFVGNGRLPNLAPGAEHELGFGRDSAVTVKYDVLGEKRGESGIISSSTTDERNYRITVTNQHLRPIEVLVIDQMPVSLNEDITVELTGNAPDKKNFEDKRGVLAWRFDLKPAAERKVTFGYQLAWPADKKITYRPSRQ